MQDAVILANRLYDIKYNRLEDVKAALIDYKEERFNGVKEQYPQSYISAKLLYGHVRGGTQDHQLEISREGVPKWMPRY
jgi:hypothetical protein